MPNEYNEKVLRPQTETTTGSMKINAEMEMASLSVKMPRFWKENPALWFCQVEAQFESPYYKGQSQIQLRFVRDR